MENKKKILIAILLFNVFSVILSGSAYFLASCGLCSGNSSTFIDISNSALSSIFISSVVSVFLLPFIFTGIFLEYLKKHLSGMILLPAAFIVVFASYIDGQMFNSMGIHVFDPVSIETVKSGNLFSLLQTDLNIVYEFIPEAVLIITVLSVGFFLSIKLATQADRFFVSVFSSVLFFPLIFIVFAALVKADGDFLPESLKNDIPGYELLHKSGKKNNVKSIVPDYNPGNKDLPVLQNRKNILLIVVESLNTFVMDPEITPGINGFFSGGNVVSSSRHISSALYTEYSVFTILYGLDNQYYRPFSAEKKRSYPVELLKKNGYRNVAVTASPLKSWRKHTKFMTDMNFDLFKEYDGTLPSDAKLVEYVKNDHIKNADKPCFYFLFLNSTHHPYNFEKKFGKYEPYQSKDFSFLKNVSDLEVRKAIKNRYLNSVTYIDHIFSRIIEIFKDDIENNNLAVIFTADHGEEFWEYGRLGHGKYFNKARYTVPLKMKLPGVDSKTVELSGHAAIFPTLIDYLEPENMKPVKKFMNGGSLLEYHGGSSYFVTGSSTFPFNDNRIMITGPAGSILAKKRGNSMDAGGSFSVIERTDPDGNQLESGKYTTVDSYLSDYLKNYMQFVKIKKKKNK